MQRKIERQHRAGRTFQRSFVSDKFTGCGAGHSFADGFRRSRRSGKPRSFPERLSDHLFARIAGELQRCAVRIQDDAIRGQQSHVFVGAVINGAELGLGALALRDVFHNRDHFDRFPRGIAAHGGRSPRPQDLPIFTEVALLDTRRIMWAFLQRGKKLARRFDIVRMREECGIARCQFFSRVSERIQIGLVDVGDSAIRAEQYHPDGRQREGRLLNPVKNELNLAVLAEKRSIHRRPSLSSHQVTQRGEQIVIREKPPANKNLCAGRRCDNRINRVVRKQNKTESRNRIQEGRCTWSLFRGGPHAPYYDARSWPARVSEKT